MAKIIMVWPGMYMLRLIRIAAPKKNPMNRIT